MVLNILFAPKTFMTSHCYIVSVYITLPFLGVSIILKAERYEKDNALHIFILFLKY